MGDLFAVADEETAIVVDVRLKSEPVPDAVSWRVPVMFRPSENWPTLVNEKLAGMRLGQSSLKTEYSRDVMAPRCFHETIEVQARTKADATNAAADAVSYATDRGLVPNWRVRIGDAIQTSPDKPLRG